MNVTSSLSSLSLLLLAVLFSSEASAEQKHCEKINCQVNKTVVAPLASTSSNGWTSSPIPKLSTVRSYYPVKPNYPESEFVPQVSISSSSVSEHTSSSSVSSSGTISSSTSSSPLPHASTPSSVVLDAVVSSASKRENANAALIPNGIKAGVAGGYALPWLNSSLGASPKLRQLFFLQLGTKHASFLCLGWYYNWNPMPNDAAGDNIQRVPMLWGIGTSSDPLDKTRLVEFTQLPVPAADYVAGFQESDFQGEGSSGVIDPFVAAVAWDLLIAPHGRAGAKLVSPSCAKQSVET